VQPPVPSTLAPTPVAGAAPTAATDSNCPNPRCKEYEQQIRDAMDEIEMRYNEQLANENKLFQSAFAAPMPGKERLGYWLGHNEAMENLQNRIRKLLRKAKDCPNIPPGAEDFLKENLPMPGRPWDQGYP
jgi:hypothetical protein